MTYSYTDELAKLRKRVVDALSEGLIDNKTKDFYEATLIQIMNDAERNRQTCLGTAENLKRQASVAEGQAQAFASFSSIIYNVLNGYVTQSERQHTDELRRAAELKEIKTEQEKLLSKEYKSEEITKQPRKRKK